MPLLSHAPFRRLARVAGSVVAALLLVGCEDDKTVSGPVDGGPDFSRMVQAMCEQSMPRTDCACLWRHSQGVFTVENITPVLEALAERDQYVPVITRGRLMAALDEERYSTLNRALFRCVRK